MKPKKTIFLILCFILCLLSSCQKEVSKEWIPIQNTDLYIWGTPNESNLFYQWDGDSFDRLIHGYGTLSVYNNDSLIEQKATTAYYGTLSNDGIATLSDGSSYIGKIQDGLFNGFGVYIKGEDIYVGTFSQSNPNGFLNWYKKGRLHYTGEWQYGKFHGEGIWYKEDGSIRTGTWENGKLSQTLVDQDTPQGHYKGYIKNDNPDGIGHFSFKDGSNYIGSWKDAKLHGNGVYTFGTDTIVGTWENGLLTGDLLFRTTDLFFEGTYIDNLPNGIGNLTVENQSYYSGSWVDGKRAGYGDILYVNGDSYFGEWEDNNYHGYGTYTYAKDSSVYNGYWKDGLHDSIGCYRSPAFEYIGEWDKGWMDGEGSIVFNNGDHYKGSVHENLIDGIGTYTFANGNFYEGEFVKGKMTGLGVFHFKNGDLFEGEFFNGKIYGDGTLNLVDNKGEVTIITGFWDLDGSFPQNASILFPNGDLYEGSFNEGKLSQEGQWTSAEERKERQDKVEKSSAHKFNEFYKKHRETINWCIVGASTVVTAVEVATGSSVIGTPVAAAMQAINMGINVVDASMAIASATIDCHEAATLGEDTSDGMKNLTAEVSINLAAVAIPAALKGGTKVLKPLGKSLKGITRSSVALVSSQASKTIIKETGLKFIKGKIMNRIVKIQVSTRKGIRCVEKKLIQNKVTQKPTIGAMRLLSTSKDQFERSIKITQTLKNNPDIALKIKLSVNGSSKNLGDNLRLLGMGKFVKLNQCISKYLNLPKIPIEPHHIIPCSPRTEAGKKAKEIWVKYFKSVDHPANGIWLGRSNKGKGYYGIAKGANHSPNTLEYEQKVAEVINNTNKKYAKKYANDPEMMQQVLGEAVDNLKKQLYKGTLGTGKDQITHTAFSIFKQPYGEITREANQIINQTSNALTY